MEGSQLSDNTRSNVNNRDTGLHFSNESMPQKSQLMVNSIDHNGVVNRQESSSSLCSWSSFDTSLTDDNSSGTDDNTPDDETRTESLTLNQFKKKNLWGQVRKAIRWSPFIQTYKKRYPWVQLAGHDGCFKAGKNGTILKKAAISEVECLQKLMKDVLRPYVPEYMGQVEENKDCFVEMQDLLAEFDAPSVMDCKMGIRTCLEAELMTNGKQPILRKDLYEKMIAVDADEPTEEENQQKGITKARYMKWREHLSSTADFGFRIEGIKNNDQKPRKDFKKTKSKKDIGKVFYDFIGGREDIQEGYLNRLKAIQATLESSPFFASHEVIGSSLLFVHDWKGNTGVWLIDFGKTKQLPGNMTLNHRLKWIEGNREDGYLIGLDNMIEIWANISHFQL